MKTCISCNKENPDDFKHCRYCGADIKFIFLKKPKTWWKRLPAWVWIIVFVAAIAGIIFGIIGSFIAISTIEGVASMALLIAGLVGFGLIPLRRPQEMGAIGRAIGLSFFALMGATIDQTGNYIYNKPIEICLCEEGTTLDRDENISNPLPGTTYIEQDFTCYNNLGIPVQELNVFAVLGIRFLEYVLLGYLLIGLRTVILKLNTIPNT
ncbi:MAG: zinc ribbon domain-containing protein [Bacteroidetes bacterium]|nr:zinc ribbon domain-containing protein [Bacteroidota bacterium]